MRFCLFCTKHWPWRDNISLLFCFYFVGNSYFPCHRIYNFWDQKIQKVSNDKYIFNQLNSKMKYTCLIEWIYSYIRPPKNAYYIQPTKILFVKMLYNFSLHRQIYCIFFAIDFHLKHYTQETRRNFPFLFSSTGQLFMAKNNSYKHKNY